MHWAGERPNLICFRDMSGSTRFPTESPVTRFKSKVDHGSEGKNRIYHGLIYKYYPILCHVIRKFTQNLPKFHPEFPQHVPNNFQDFPTVQR